MKIFSSSSQKQTIVLLRKDDWFQQDQMLKNENQKIFISWNIMRKYLEMLIDHSDAKKNSVLEN